MAFIYHERQLGGLCGVHCLNNLLQGPHFGPGDLAEIGVQLDAQERALLQEADAAGGAADIATAAPAVGEPVPGGLPGTPDDVVDGSGAATCGGVSASLGDVGLDGQPYNVDPSADGGNFSIQVLTVALHRFGLELLPAKHPRARQPMQDPGRATDAFLVQYRDHWFAVRKVADCWWNLNSTRTKPAMVGPFYLAAWLAQLSAEGYSIYLVMGEAMPPVAQPRDPQTPEENFHEVFDLLEEAKRSGGNPLAGGQEDDGDAAAAAAAAAAWEAEDLQAQSGALALNEDALAMAMLRMQQDLWSAGGARNQAPAGRNGGRSADSGRRAGSPVRPDAQRLRAQGAAPSQPPGNGLLARWFPSLSACICSTVETGDEEVVNDTTARGITWPTPASGSGAMASALPAGGSPSPWQGMLAENQLADFGGGSLPASPEALNTQALLDMGFREPLVRVAQELAKAPRSPPLLQLLIRAQEEADAAAGAGRQDATAAERLAQAIQAAVLECDTAGYVSFGERLLKGVALLCRDTEQLNAARAHVDFQALEEFLRSVLRNHGGKWPPLYGAAGRAALEFLSAVAQGGGPADAGR